MVGLDVALSLGDFLLQLVVLLLADVDLRLDHCLLLRQDFELILQALCLLVQLLGLRLILPNLFVERINLLLVLFLRHGRGSPGGHPEVGANWRTQRHNHGSCHDDRLGGKPLGFLRCGHSSVGTRNRCGGLFHISYGNKRCVLCQHRASFCINAKSLGNGEWLLAMR